MKHPDDEQPAKPVIARDTEASSVPVSGTGLPKAVAQHYLRKIASFIREPTPPMHLELGGEHELVPAREKSVFCKKAYDSALSESSKVSVLGEVVGFTPAPPKPFESSLDHNLEPDIREFPNGA